MSPAAAATRVGRCPGALRPMASGDGLIVRVKPRGGRLSREQGIGIAAAAARFGSGALELTSRANLQIRGVCEHALDGITAALDRLALLDVSPDAEARRNIVASPLAGFDPAAAFDIRPAVEALEDRLSSETALAGLPQKFGFAVADGGAWPLDDVPADARFEAVRGEDGAPLFAIRLDGDGKCVAICAASEMPDVAVRLARIFVAARRERDDLHRMRDLVAGIGAAAVFAAAGLEPVRPSAEKPAASARCVGLLPLSVVAGEAEQSGRPLPGEAISRGQRPIRRCSAASLPRVSPRDDGVAERDPGDLLSGSSGRPLPGGEKHAFVLGIGAPFGRLDAAQLDLVARSGPEMRLTPWRAIMVPGLDEGTAERLAAESVAAGLIVDPDDPRLSVAACAGAPGCRRGTTPTLDDAARWAPLLAGRRGIALHVSGCGKGCAHPGPAALTLVGRDGRYDVVVDGGPGDAPVALALDAAETRRLIRTTLARDGRP